MMNFNILGILKKYFGAIALGGTTAISNAYQYLEGHTPWLSNITDYAGGNIWIVVIVGAIVISLLMKLVRVVLNGLMIAAVVGLIFFHEPVMNYLNNNKDKIKSTVQSGVNEVKEEVEKEMDEATQDKPVFNGGSVN